MVCGSDSMNYVQVFCGLGNQLFQYVFSRYLEKVTGKESVLYFKEKSDSFDCFNLSYIPLDHGITVNEIVYDNGFCNVEPSSDNKLYAGWWQNRDYLMPVLDRVIGDLTLKEEYITPDLAKLEKELMESESVALHFRRTDYVTGDGARMFVSLDMSYYEEAISLISETIGSDNLKIYLFSDDFDYISGITDICGIPVLPMPSRKAHEDMFLMSKCHHHVIANSTFSWWGAVMSPYRDFGITVAPDKWYLAMPSPNLYLDNWMKL